MSNTDKHDDQALAESLSQKLDTLVDTDKSLSLDDQLAAMRRKALDQMPAPQQQTSILAWVLGRTGERSVLAWPGAGLAMITLVMVGWLVTSQPVTDVSEGNVPLLSQMDVLLEGEDIDMLAEDEMEFYMWLEGELEAG